MNHSIDNLIRYTDETYIPVLLRLSKKEDKEIYNSLISNQATFVSNEIKGQLFELVKSRNPSIRMKSEEYPTAIQEHLNGINIDEYGVWVYYPWSKRLVHLLDEAEFIELRTNRNQYKITKEERDILSTKKIGIVGLSVGQSIALTMAMERTCGELRLADFDVLELSNLNRIRTGVHNLGVPKVVIAAREIAEIDPFIKVKIYPEGLNKDNIDNFFNDGATIDAVVEVCDGLDIKIETRYKARSLGIPVIMDTNDKGMLDVERFDLQPERPVLHGLADGLNPENIKQLSNEAKIPYILKMVGADTISARMKASMLEVEQSITTWPQLASSVILGGALTTDVCRRILLDQFHDSGRYYVDFENLISDKEVKELVSVEPQNPHHALDSKLIEEQLAGYFKLYPQEPSPVSESFVNDIIKAAIAAPSAGNNQPWKWAQQHNCLFLFHDKYKSWSWGDCFEMGAFMGLGTAIENVRLQAAALGKDTIVEFFPMKEKSDALIATIRFKDLNRNLTALEDLLNSQIFIRCTNRKLGNHDPLQQLFYSKLQEVAAISAPIQLFYIQEDAELGKLGNIIAECDRIRLLNQQGHKEFYQEVRWTHEEAATTRDGIDIASADLSQSEIAGFGIGKDWEAISLLSKWNMGSGLKRMSIKSLKAASGMVLVTIPHFNAEALLEAGQAIERMMLFCTAEKISVHPMLSPIFFLNKLKQGDLQGLTQDNIKLLKELSKEFRNIFGIDEGIHSSADLVFLMKLSKADPSEIKSLRKPKNELFINFDQNN